MNARIYLIALSALFIMGCSYDTLDDPVQDNSAFELSIMNAESKAMMEMPFKIREDGFFKMVESNDCNGLDQVEMKGSFKFEAIGMLYTKASMCTDHKGQNFIRGMHMSNAGDELFFYSDISGSDDGGNYYIYIYYDGRGRFINAYGKIKVYHRENLHGQKKGTYQLSGVGVLSYGK